MKPPIEIEAALASPPASLAQQPSDVLRVPFTRFLIFVAALSLCFTLPLVDWVRLALKTELFSHVLLIPLVSAYFIWMGRADLPRDPVRSNWLAAVPALAGLAGIVGYWMSRAGGISLAREDYLALMIGSYVCFIIAGALAFLGSRIVRALAFPLGFLVFAVPFPNRVTLWIEIFFQHASAEVAAMLFALTGTPVFRVGMVFQMPGLVIRVAEECSGIRSSLVLFITSLVAGYWFLHSPWRRAALTLFVIPLGVVRNAIRILTISLLTIHVDPNVIHGPLHKRGGPIFFLMSLVPFFLFLVWLRWTERKTTKPGGAPSPDEGSGGTNQSGSIVAKHPSGLTGERTKP